MYLHEDRYRERRELSVNCTDLLGYDLSDPAAHAEAQEKRIAGQKCPKLVEDAVLVLEKIIKAHP